MIKEFKKEFSFLSNFFIHKEISYDGLRSDNVEALFQAMKAFSRFDAIQIAGCSSPSEAKRLGRQIKMKPNWDSIKVGIMKEILIEKFRIPKLRQKLLDTGSEYLQEGNWWGDTFWGVCKGVGDNNLGKLLMEIRQEIRDGKL